MKECSDNPGEGEDDIVEQKRKEFVERNKEFLDIVKKQGKHYKQRKAGQLSLGLKRKTRILFCECEIYIDEWSCLVCMKCVNCCKCK